MDSAFEEAGAEMIGDTGIDWKGDAHNESVHRDAYNIRILLASPEEVKH